MTKVVQGDYKDILKPYQIEILKEFFSEPQAEGYFLTGGTALAAFYLHHRYSKDLDFFKIGEFDTFFIDRFIRRMGEKHVCAVISKVKSPTYCEYYLSNNQTGWVQRLDFVKEQPVRFGDLHNQDGIIYDDLINIATNKICAIYGRLEPKDYVDLYLTVNDLGLDFDRCFDLAKQKDAGLHEFYFANILEKISLTGLKGILLKELTEDDLNKFYDDIKVRLLKRVKPE